MYKCENCGMPLAGMETCDCPVGVAARQGFSFATRATPTIPAAEAVIYVKLYRDGNQMCALIGANIQEGLAGFGNSHADALQDLVHTIQRARRS